jgi:hypothetical protein
MFKLFIFLFLLILSITILLLRRKKSTFVVNGNVKYKMEQENYNVKTIPLKLDQITDEVFYTDTPWSTSNNNYIYDKLEDRYYIIDKGYYYHINDPERYKLKISKNVNVNSFKIKIFN